MNIDKTVIKETKYISIFVGIFSVLMEILFLCSGYWDYRVLLGNLWGALLAIGNFFAMGIFVQKAVGQDEAQAKMTVKTSMTVRFLILLAFLVIGFLIPVFNKIAVAAPLLFPSFGVYMRPLVDKIRK